MLAGVARRLKRGIDDGMNPGEVFSRVQDHVIARGPRARRAAGARGVRREGRGRWRTATTRSRSACSATCTRCDHRGGPGLVHGARPAHRAALQGDQPRDQRAVPQDPAARPRPRRRVRRPGGDAAQHRSLIGPLRDRLPRLGGWVGRPALGVVLRLDGRAPDRRRRALGGRRSRATCACCTPPPARSAGSPRARGCSTSRAAAGSRCAGCSPARASTTSPPTSPRRCSTGPRSVAAEHGVADQVTTSDRRRRGRCRSRTQSFDLVVSFTGLHCFPDPARAVVEMARVLKLGGVITGSALLNDTGLRLRADAPGRPARPGCSARAARPTRSAAGWPRQGVADVTLDVSGADGATSAASSAGGCGSSARSASSRGRP